MTGHAALLLASATYGFELYNFSPFDNKSAFAQGAIAQTVDTIDSFDAFVERCAANNFEGIEIQNGYTQWREPYKRAIKLGVTDNQLAKIRDYAQAIKAKPPRFSFFGGYSCSNFCCSALKCADIYFEDAQGRDIGHAYPNHIYTRAVGAHNVQSFEKIDFRE